MIETTEHPLTPWLEQGFGALNHIPFSDSCPACVLEAAAQARVGLTPATADLERWTDEPGKAGLPDIRPLNDAYLSDERRTSAMGRLAIAYWDWAEWGEARQREVMTRVVELTIRRVLPIALRAAGLEAEALRCEADGDEASAKAAYAAADADAAYAAYAAAAYAADADYAAYAAYAAAAYAADAYAAYDAAAYAAAYAASAVYASAARAVYAAGRDETLDVAVDCWIEAL